MADKPSFFKRCPKSGKIVGIKPSVPMGRFILPVIGFFALVWFVLRTFTKPSRLGYPCQQVAAPLAGWFLAWAASLFASWNLFRLSKRHMGAREWSAATIALVGAVGVIVMVSQVDVALSNPEETNTGIYTPRDLPNTPIGEAQGIFPGRVSWAHDRSAMNLDPNNSQDYPAARNWNQDRLDNMLRRVVLNVTGTADLKTAWNRLFEARNQLRGQAGVGYQRGQRIAVKVNLNNRGSNSMADAVPQIILSLLRQLVDSVGVNQSDILVYDAIRAGTGNTENHMRSVCAKQFANVRYNDFGTEFTAGLTFTNRSINSNARQMPKWVVDADYLVNFAMLKKHAKEGVTWRDPLGQTGITMNAKNHFGTTSCPSCLHEYIRDWYRPNANGSKYSALVDLMSDPNLRDKTVIYLVDGLLSGSQWNSRPVKWKMEPFNGYYPASVFASMDPVAMEAVGLDFMNTEMRLMANADNHLREAALIANPPSGTNYVNKRNLRSLGVFEHWNNPVDKKYSRNLGTGKGIELVKVALDGQVASVQPKATRVDLDVRPSGTDVHLRSPSVLVSARFFDAKGVRLASHVLGGRETVLPRPVQAGKLFLEVTTTEGSRTFGL